jgi:hypothetical protein
MGWRVERALSRSRCHRGTVVFVAACPYCGTQNMQGKRERFGIKRIGGLKVQRGSAARVTCDSEPRSGKLASKKMNGDFHFDSHRCPIKQRWCVLPLPHSLKGSVSQ